MNKTQIAKVLKKVAGHDDSYGIGFNRLMALPAKTRKWLNATALLNGQSTDEIHNNQKKFFSEMSDSEFYDWLVIHG